MNEDYMYSQFVTHIHHYVYQFSNDLSHHTHCLLKQSEYYHSADSWSSIDGWHGHTYIGAILRLVQYPELYVYVFLQRDFPRSRMDNLRTAQLIITPLLDYPVTVVIIHH